MDNFFQISKPKTSVYFVGGCALNIGVDLQWHDNVAFIDTCDKNLTDRHNLDNTFITEGTRGAGGNRRYIYPKVVNQIKRILEDFPSGDFNIVCFSGSGGSGSTIAPLLIAELTKQGESVVGVMVSGIESSSVVQNAIDTLKTLEGIAANNGKPVVVNHTCNLAGVPYTAINHEVVKTIHALINLTNQQHSRLDVMDVNNWLQYTTKLTAMHPQLSLLHVCDNRQDANAIPEMISVASLYTDASREVPFTSPYISTTGIADATDNMVAEQLHFVINSLGVTETMKQLEDVKLEQHRHQVKHIQRTSIVDIDDNRNADGFVL